MCKKIICDRLGKDLYVTSWHTSHCHKLFITVFMFYWSISCFILHGSLLVYIIIESNANSIIKRGNWADEFFFPTPICFSIKVQMKLTSTAFFFMIVLQICTFAFKPAAENANNKKINKKTPSRLYNQCITKVDVKDHFFLHYGVRCCILKEK